MHLCVIGVGFKRRCLRWGTRTVQISQCDRGSRRKGFNGGMIGDSTSLVVSSIGGGFLMGSSSLSLYTYTGLGRPRRHQKAGLVVATIFHRTMSSLVVVGPMRE